MRSLLSLTLVFGFTGFGSSFAAFSAAAQDETGSQQMDDTQSARPFEGKITKAANDTGTKTNDVKLVLLESSTGQSYALDNQKAAKQYAGKNVKVIATIDPKTNTLHVIDIRPDNSGK
jgi:hypothetical protein